MYILLSVTGNVLILKIVPCIVFSDEHEEPHPVPPPRLKKKAKVASIITITRFNKSADKCVPNIPSKQKNGSKASSEKRVTVNDCCCTDVTNKNNSTICILTAGESTSEAVNEKAIKSDTISCTVCKREQCNHHNINEREVGEINNVCARSEGCGQDGSGVYLPTVLPSVKTEQRSSLVHAEHDFKCSAIQDASRCVICLNSLLDNSHKVNSECEVVTGLPKNYTSCLSVTNDPEHLLNEAPTHLCNTYLGKAFPSAVDNSHILIENTGEAVKDTVKKICRCVEHEESLKVMCTGNSHVRVNSTVGHSVCCSDGTLDVLHGRDEDISTEALSQNNTVFQFWLREESVHADTVLGLAAADAALEYEPAGTGLEPVPADKGVESVHSDGALERVPADRGLKPVPAVRELEPVPTDRDLESLPAERGLGSVLVDRTLESVPAVTVFEPMPADRTLESSLSLSTNQCNFNHSNHGTEENTYIRQSGLGLLSCNEELNVSLIKSGTPKAKLWGTGISLVNDLTNATSRNNSTTAAGKILQKRTMYDKGYCLYSALENFESVSDIENREKQWVVSDSVKMINWEHTGYKNKNYKSHVGSGEMHPNKISKSFHLFVNNMLMGSEEYDLSYHGDNTEGSVTYKCAFNQSDDTNLTEKTNERVLCSEFNKEESAKLPVPSKASYRCIAAEPSIKSGVFYDNMHNGSEYCNQHECSSENSCVVSVVSMNTTVPSCDESCQPSLHGGHQLSLTSNCYSNIIHSEEATEYVSAIDRSAEVSVMKIGEDANETRTEESFTMLKTSDTWPSSGSTDEINKSCNNSYSQTAVASKVPFVAKIKTKPLKKSGANEECLDGMRIKMENNSG
jgi:hypothetical protein